jgi:hypothetical protein
MSGESQYLTDGRKPGAIVDAILLSGGDNVYLPFGADNDVVMGLRTAVLNANTALANVLIGTPVAQALAANSFILSNVTASGDIAFYGNLGGHSQQFLLYDTSASILYLMGTVTHVGATNVTASGLLTLQGNNAQDITMWGTLGTGRTLSLLGTTATNGAVNDSPTLKMSAFYDADPTAGVTSTVWDYTILHDMITGGATPKSQVIHIINDVACFTIENNNGTITSTLAGLKLSGLLDANGQNVGAAGVFYVGAAGIFSSGVNDSYIDIYGGTASGGAWIRMFGSTHATTPGQLIINTPNAAGAGTARATFTGKLNTDLLTITNCALKFADAASLPEADPHVAGQLYQIVATHVVMVSAG